MKLYSIVATLAFFAAASTATPATAQEFHLRPGLTEDTFKELTADAGSILRFRQLGNPATLGRGRIDLSVQFGSTSRDDARFPQGVARFGVNDRLDVGAWGGFNTASKYGVVGFDTNIALMKQGPSWPVSVSLRPSVASLVGPSEIWVGNASIDLTVSRAIGPFSPYAGVATTGSMGIERADDIALDPVTAHDSVRYAGLAYRWRALVAAVEIERTAVTSYGFRIGTRF